MVTKNRPYLAKRALQCFANQSWESKELVIVDDGEESYESVIEPYRERFAIRYHRVSPAADRYLGALRNVTLDLAEGEFCAQWDDDDWYHPDRLAVQMRAIEHQRLDAVLLRWTLMHLDTPEFLEHPYRTQLRRGTPGTILHRQTPLRYPNLPRSEDSVFRRELGRSQRLGIVDQLHSHLFIRCFHGANTWEIEHFTERLHRSFLDKTRYFRARFIARDLFSHPLFQLTPAERHAVRLFFEESRELGAIQS
jgi:glycosyltransferase involved in cell wall biosynthesis